MCMLSFIRTGLVEVVEKALTKKKYKRSLTILLNISLLKVIHSINKLLKLMRNGCYVMIWKKRYHQIQLSQTYKSFVKYFQESYLIC